jgi:hypothetical protein
MLILPYRQRRPRTISMPHSGAQAGAIAPHASGVMPFNAPTLP